MDFWDYVGFFFWGYVFFAYLMFLIAIVADIFRDSELSGWIKAVWMLFLIFIPFLTALVYLVAREPGMRDRRVAGVRAASVRDNSSVGSAASSSPSDEIAKARALLDAGSITRSEFDGLKARAMAGSQARAV